MCNVVVPTSCLCSQDDDDEVGENGENDDDDDDGFYVPHGYLSDGEGAVEEEVRFLNVHVAERSERSVVALLYPESLSV